MAILMAKNVKGAIIAGIAMGELAGLACEWMCACAYMNSKCITGVASAAGAWTMNHHHTS